MKKKTLISLVLALVVAAVLVGVAVLAFSGQDDTNQKKSPKNNSTNQNQTEDTQDKPDKPVADNSVNIKNFTYKPGAITVKVGTTVTWTNQDKFAQTITSDKDSPVKFDSGPLGEGDSYSFKFTKAGTYKYHSELYEYLHGTVVVTE